MAKNSKNIVTRRLIRSYVTSVMSISLVLMLVAATSIFAVNARSIARYFKENMAVSVMLKQTVTDEEARFLTEKFSIAKYVKASRLISKEEGAGEMKALLGEDFLDIFEASPIPVSIELHLDGNVITKDSLSVIKASILENDIVEEVVYQETLVDALNANLHRISMVLAVVIALLMVISFALISNTVRLNIYARRFTIHTMSLVGARRSFIARPFILQGAVQGLVAGIIAAGVFGGILVYVKSRSPFIASIMNLQINVYVLSGTVLLGMVICVISTLFVVSRIAFISKDDLYY